MRNAVSFGCGTKMDGFWFEGRHYDLDAHGHLRDSGQWSPALGRALALRDDIDLGREHWWLIEFVRDYHQTYGTPPLMRVLVKALREHRDDPGLGSRELYRLFADSPVKQACKYGGLPPPEWCI